MDNNGRPKGSWLALILPLAFFSFLFAPDISREAGGFWPAFGLMFLSLSSFLGVFWVNQLHKDNQDLRRYTKHLMQQYERETGKKPPKVRHGLLNDNGHDRGSWRSND